MFNFLRRLFGSHTQTPLPASDHCGPEKDDDLTAAVQRAVRKPLPRQCLQPHEFDAFFTDKWDLPESVLQHLVVCRLCRIGLQACYPQQNLFEALARRASSARRDQAARPLSRAALAKLLEDVGHLQEVMRGRFEPLGSRISGRLYNTYPAFDREKDRPVALKVFSEEVKPHWKKVKERTEAHSKAPGVAQVLDMFEDENRNRFYLVEEFLAGGSLADRFTDQPQPMEFSAAWIQSIPGLATGQPHLALNPESLGFRSENDWRRPVVTDFGLGVCLLENPSDYFAHFTRTDRRFYMAPEALNLEVSPQGSHAVDVFSLGAMFLESVSNEPFLQADSLSEAIEATRETALVQRIDTILRCHPELQRFENVLRMSLDYNLEKRYKTPGKMSEALARVAAVA